MTFEEEVEHVKREHRRVWDWLIKPDGPVQLPKFNDDDEMYFTKEERDNGKRN